MPNPTNPDMDFTTALLEVMNGNKITRHEWNDTKIYVFLRDGFLSIKNYDGYHRLLVSEADMFAKDWHVINNGKAFVN